MTPQEAGGMLGLTCLANLPFVLRIDDAEYHCSMGKNSFVARVRLIHKDPTQKGSTANFVFKPATGEVQLQGELDLPGVANRYTELGIAYFVPVQTTEVSEEQRQGLITLAYRYAVAFLEGYRYFFNEPEVYPLSPGEFFSLRHGKGVRVHFDVRCGNVGNEIIGTTFGMNGLSLKQRRPYAEERQTAFRGFLESDMPPPVVSLLLLNADMYVARGDHRLAVIEAGTALDIQVEERALRLLIDRGDNRSAAEKKLESASTKWILENILAASPSSDLRGSQEWQAYDCTFRRLRNRVVHDGYEPSRAEAGDCVRVFATLVGKLTDGERPGNAGGAIG